MACGLLHDFFSMYLSCPFSIVYMEFGGRQEELSYDQQYRPFAGSAALKRTNGHCQV